ncbi:MAG: putative signal transducing protein [Candidatus Xenobia bacterium]
MKHCPNRHCPDYKELHKSAEYEDSATACHRCGTALVDGAGPEDVVVERDLVRIYTSTDYYEAEVVKSALEAAGIRVRAIPEDLFSVLGGVLPLECAPELWVKSTEVERAKQVLENAKQTTQHRPWHCPNCGTKVTGDLVECWKCTTRRPRKVRPAEPAAAAVEAPPAEPGK